VLALMIGSSIAVIGYFVKYPEDSPSVWVRVVAPTAAALLMLGMWLVMLTNSQTMIGAPRFGALHLVLLAFLVATLVIGLIRAQVLRRSEPDAWARLAGPTRVESDFAATATGAVYAGKAF
jgi:heme A synthase